MVSLQGLAREQRRAKLGGVVASERCGGATRNGPLHLDVDGQAGEVRCGRRIARNHLGSCASGLTLDATRLTVASASQQLFGRCFRDLRACFPETCRWGGMSALIRAAPTRRSPFQHLAQSTRVGIFQKCALVPTIVVFFSRRLPEARRSNEDTLLSRNYAVGKSVPGLSGLFATSTRLAAKPFGGMAAKQVSQMGPIGTQRIDADKGVDGNALNMSRLAGRFFRRKGEGARSDLFAAMPPLEAKRMLVQMRRPTCRSHSTNMSAWSLTRPTYMCASASRSGRSSSSQGSAAGRSPGSAGGFAGKGRRRGHRRRSMPRSCRRQDTDDDRRCQRCSTTRWVM